MWWWFLLLPIAIEAITEILVKEKVFEWYRNLVDERPVIGYSSKCPKCTSAQVGIFLVGLFYIWAPASQAVVIAFSASRLSQIVHMVYDFTITYFITQLEPMRYNDIPQGKEILTRRDFQ